MGNLPDKAVCQNYTSRDQHSYDFLVCEGKNGWSATHVIGPFGLMMVLGSVLLAWLITGIVEILETFGLTTFNSYVIFHTNDSELETIAGSLLGDWLFNDLFGVLSAWVLLYGLKAPALLGSWVFQKHPPPTGYRVKLVFAAIFILAPNLAPTWIMPADCDADLNETCVNIGLMINVALQSIVILFFWLYFFRRPDDYRYLWNPHKMTERKINYYFGFWLAFVIVVGLQNAQPYIPLYQDSPVSEWGQVWLADFVWVMVVFFVIYIFQLHKEPSKRRGF